MKIITTATAFPPHYFLQEEVVEALKTQWEDGLENAAVLERLHYRTGVAGRYFTLPLLEYPPLDTWGKTNKVWIETAERLGEQAMDCVLNKAGVDRKQIGALYFVSVTGVSSPSVDALLVNRMRLNPQIKRNPIFGLGCVAGAAGLARAADYVRAYPDQVAVLLSVELCSLTWQRDDFTVANLIATGLFGDGAVAVLVAGDQVKLKGPRILGTASSFYPDTQDVMGWKISEKGFQVVLSPDVPTVVQGKSGTGCGRLPGSARNDPRPGRLLDHASRRPQSAGGGGRCAWTARWRTATLVGRIAARGQPILGLGARSAG